MQAMTTRGVKEDDTKHIARFIHEAIQNRNDDEKLQHLVQTNTALRHISRPTAELMRDYASLRRLPRKSKEGDYNMCKAIEDMQRKSEEVGMELGTLKSIKTTMQKLNYTAEQALEFFDIPRKDFKKYMSML